MRFLLTSAIVILIVPAHAGTNWDIPWSTLDAGGTMTASGGNWQLKGTIGQPDATQNVELGGGQWRVTGGFWSLFAEPVDQVFQDRFEAGADPGFSFSVQLAPTFQHPRCTTCHAVAATNFQTVNDNPPGVLPAGHPTVNAQTDCTSCHTSSLLPATGTIDPGWQSAPVAFDFRDLDAATLCTMASQPVSGHTPLEHMTEDKLVLWAVGDGRLPFGNNVPTAPPNDIQAWRDLITDWVNAGMPCD